MNNETNTAFSNIASINGNAPVLVEEDHVVRNSSPIVQRDFLFPPIAWPNTFDVCGALSSLFK